MIQGYRFHYASIMTWIWSQKVMKQIKSPNLSSNNHMHSCAHTCMHSHTNNTSYSSKRNRICCQYMWHTPLKGKQAGENKHLGLRLSIWQVYLKFCFKYEYKCQPKLLVGFYLYSLIQQTCTRHSLRCESHENESNIIPFKYLQCRCIVENRKEKKWTAGIVLSEVCSWSCGTKVLQKATENSSQNRRVLSLTLRNNRENNLAEKMM